MFVNSKTSFSNMENGWMRNNNGIIYDFRKNFPQSSQPWWAFMLFMHSDSSKNDSYLNRYECFTFVNETCNMQYYKNDSKPETKTKKKTKPKALDDVDGLCDVRLYVCCFCRVDADIKIPFTLADWSEALKSISTNCSGLLCNK